MDQQRNLRRILHILWSCAAFVIILVIYGCIGFSSFFGTWLRFIRNAFLRISMLDRNIHSATSAGNKSSKDEVRVDLQASNCPRMSHDTDYFSVFRTFLSTIAFYRNLLAISSGGTRVDNAAFQRRENSPSSTLQSECLPDLERNPPRVGENVTVRQRNLADKYEKDVSPKTSTKSAICRRSYRLSVIRPCPRKRLGEDLAIGARLHSHSSISEVKRGRISNVKSKESGKEISSKQISAPTFAVNEGAGTSTQPDIEPWYKNIRNPNTSTNATIYIDAGQPHQTIEGSRNDNMETQSSPSRCDRHSNDFPREALRIQVSPSKSPGYINRSPLSNYSSETYPDQNNLMRNSQSSQFNFNQQCVEQISEKCQFGKAILQMSPTAVSTPSKQSSPTGSSKESPSEQSSLDMHLKKSPRKLPSDTGICKKTAKQATDVTLLKTASSEELKLAVPIADNSSNEGQISKQLLPEHESVMKSLPKITSEETLLSTEAPTSREIFKKPIGLPPRRKKKISKLPNKSRPDLDGRRRSENPPASTSRNESQLHLEGLAFQVEQHFAIKQMIPADKSAKVAPPKNLGNSLSRSYQRSLDLPSPPQLSVDTTEDNAALQQLENAPSSRFKKESPPDLGPQRLEMSPSSGSRNESLPGLQEPQQLENSQSSTSRNAVLSGLEGLQQLENSRSSTFRNESLPSLEGHQRLKTSPSSTSKNESLPEYEGLALRVGDNFAVRQRILADKFGKGIPPETSTKSVSPRHSNQLSLNDPSTPKHLGDDLAIGARLDSESSSNSEVNHGKSSNFKGKKSCQEIFPKQISTSSIDEEAGTSTQSDSELSHEIIRKPNTSTNPTTCIVKDHRNQTLEGSRKDNMKMQGSLSRSRYGRPASDFPYETSRRAASPSESPGIVNRSHLTNHPSEIIPEQNIMVQNTQFSPYSVDQQSVEETEEKCQFEKSVFRISPIVVSTPSKQSSPRGSRNESQCEKSPSNLSYQNSPHKRESTHIIPKSPTIPRETVIVRFKGTPYSVSQISRRSNSSSLSPEKSFGECSKKQDPYKLSPDERRNESFTSEESPIKSSETSTDISSNILRPMIPREENIAGTNLPFEISICTQASQQATEIHRQIQTSSEELNLAIPTAHRDSDEGTRHKEFRENMKMPNIRTEETLLSRETLSSEEMFITHKQSEETIMNKLPNESPTKKKKGSPNESPAKKKKGSPNESPAKKKKGSPNESPVKKKKRSPNEPSVQKKKGSPSK